MEERATSRREVTMQILQTDESGKTVADLGPPVPDDTPANLDITVTAKSVPRPSLEVETEVHTHLAPRLEAHLRRIMGWDTRWMPMNMHHVLADAVESVRKGFAELTDAFEVLRTENFVAKTTPSSRKRAALKCAIGCRVQLRADIGDEMCGLFYSAEELSNLTLSKVGESSALVMTAGGREIGPLPFAHVELVDG
jgi:hypothetical protein